MRLTLTFAALALAGAALAGCSRPATVDGTESRLFCPTARDMARMDNTEVQGWVDRGCSFSCPARSGKSARRFWRRMDEPQLLVNRERGCQPNHHAERRLDRWLESQ